MEDKATMTDPIVDDGVDLVYHEVGISMGTDITAALEDDLNESTEDLDDPDDPTSVLDFPASDSDIDEGSEYSEENIESRPVNPINWIKWGEDYKFYLPDNAEEIVSFQVIRPGLYTNGEFQRKHTYLQIVDNRLLICTPEEHEQLLNTIPPDEIEVYHNTTEFKIHVRLKQPK